MVHNLSIFLISIYLICVELNIVFSNFVFFLYVTGYLVVIVDTAFSKPLQLSSELSEFMGDDTAARTEVVKHVWKYIKQQNLQNPKDRREILCDETLEKIFKRKKVTMFSMNKYLSAVSQSI